MPGSNDKRECATGEESPPVSGFRFQVSAAPLAYGRIEQGYEKDLFVIVIVLVVVIRPMPSAYDYDGARQGFPYHLPCKAPLRTAILGA